MKTQIAQVQPEHIQDNHALAEELLKIFVARRDVYAAQTSDGKYYPVEEDLTVEVIQKHLDGHHTIGTYLLNAEDKVKVLVLDVDLTKEALSQIEQYRPSLKEVAGKVLGVCGDLGLDAIVEDSGNKGYHVILLFDKETDSTIARTLGRRILESVGQLPNKINIELFPKQDHKQSNGFGNLVKLPCGVHLKSGRRSEILDPATFLPAEDPLVNLRQITAVGDAILSSIVVPQSDAVGAKAI